MSPSSDPLGVGSVLQFPTEGEVIESPAVPAPVKVGKATKTNRRFSKADPIDSESDLGEETEPAPLFKLTCLADVKEEPVEWLWPNRVGLGNITILAGEPGLGKSTVTMDMAARSSSE